MKKRKLKKLGIHKATISQLSQHLVNGGGTHTCPAACCPTEFETCQATCAETCAATCEATCANCGGGGSGGTGDSRFCPDNY